MAIGLRMRRNGERIVKQMGGFRMAEHYHVQITDKAQLKAHILTFRKTSEFATYYSQLRGDS